MVSKILSCSILIRSPAHFLPVAGQVAMQQLRHRCAVFLHQRKRGRCSHDISQRKQGWRPQVDLIRTKGIRLDASDGRGWVARFAHGCFPCIEVEPHERVPETQKGHDLRRSLFGGMKEIGSLTAATHTARLAAAVMASGAVSVLCRGHLAVSSLRKLCHPAVRRQCRLNLSGT